jgi:hypothetical protein
MSTASEGKASTDYISRVVGYRAALHTETTHLSGRRLGRQYFCVTGSQT